MREQAKAMLKIAKILDPLPQELQKDITRAIYQSYGGPMTPAERQREFRLNHPERSGRRAHLNRDHELRLTIRRRDGDRCRYCGETVNWVDRRSPLGGTYDHVNPNGDNSPENLVVACRRCNTTKNNRTPVEAGLLLLEPGSEPGSEQGHNLGPDLGTSLPPTTPLHTRVSKNFRSEALEVLNFLNLKANKNFRAIETNLRPIIARLSSGVGIEECKWVISRQVSEWNGTEMVKYLRPETLFNATKFESYLGQKLDETAPKSQHVSLPEPTPLTDEEHAHVLGQIRGVVTGLANAQEPIPPRSAHALSRNKTGYGLKNSGEANRDGHAAR